MNSVNSYQDINTPDEEENLEELMMEELMAEYDSDCGDYQTYLSNCRRIVHRRRINGSYKDKPKVIIPERGGRKC